MSTAEKLNEMPLDMTIEQAENAQPPQPSNVLLEHDAIAQDIVGGHLADMPPGYYTRPAFLGTFTVGASALQCLPN
jgi:hypothetical protein